MSVVNPQYEDVESSSHSPEITVEVSSSALSLRATT